MNRFRMSLVGAVCLLLCGQCFATDYLGGFLGPYGQGRLNVTNSQTLTSAALTGTVYKTGSAQLTLANPVSSNGTLAVEVGSARLTSSNADAVLEGLSSVSDTPVEAAVEASANLTVGNLTLGSTLVKRGRALCPSRAVSSARELTCGPVRSVRSMANRTTCRSSSRPPARRLT